MLAAEALMRLILAMPRCRATNALKAGVLRLLGGSVGRRVTIYPGTWVFPGRNLEIEDDVDLAYGVVITTTGGVRIGARTLIGYRAQILSANHAIPPLPHRIFDSGHAVGAVDIGRDVWVGANVCILAGVQVGDGAVIGAGSVVTRAVPPGAIVAGNPARIIRFRERCGGN